MFYIFPYSVDSHNKGYMKSLAFLDSNGNVFWPPIVKFRSSCKMDITYFPFDDQVCSLKLGSWAYDGYQVDVTNRSLDVDTTRYVDNGEWTLIGTKAVRRVVRYPCCPEPFPDVTFYIHIRRRVLYYAFNVIIPCALLSSLTLTGFLLPPDSGEKVTLGLTVLLAFSVFMLLIAENMPATSEYIPLIGERERERDGDEYRRIRCVFHAKIESGSNISVTYADLLTIIIIICRFTFLHFKK